VIYISDAARRVVLDHMSGTWGTDELLNLGANFDAGPIDVTVQNSLFGEPLVTTDVGCPYDPTTFLQLGENVAIYKSAFEGKWRLPRLGSGGTHDIRNSIFYNNSDVTNGDAEDCGSPSWRSNRVNLISNLWKSNFLAPTYPEFLTYKDLNCVDPKVCEGVGVYLRGNKGWNADWNTDQSAMLGCYEDWSGCGSPSDIHACAPANREACSRCRTQEPLPPSWPRPGRSPTTTWTTAWRTTS
jgi:hypothetical protein